MKENKLLDHIDLFFLDASIYEELPNRIEVKPQSNITKEEKIADEK